MSEPAREVYDGWHSWRARIVPWPSPIRRRLGLRFVRERRFPPFDWEQVGVSRWFADEGACEDAANAWLDSKHHDGRLVR